MDIINIRKFQINSKLKFKKLTKYNIKVFYNIDV